MKLRTAINEADKILVSMVTSDAMHFRFKITKAEARRELKDLLEYHVPSTTENAEDIWNEKISDGAFLCELAEEEGELHFEIRLS